MKAVLEAAALLEALRPAAAAALGARAGAAENPEDQPILDAFELARRQLRAACVEYLLQ